MKEERVNVADHMSGATSRTTRNENVSANGLNVKWISARLRTAVMGTIQRRPKTLLPPSPHLSLLVEATAEVARAMAYAEKSNQ
jgi:hypothetical protein